MAPYQFFLLLVGVLFIGVSAVAFNQAVIASDHTPTRAVVESVPDAPAPPATPDPVRI